MEIVTVVLVVALGLFMTVGALALVVDTFADWLKHRKHHKFMKEFRKGKGEN